MSKIPGFPHDGFPEGWFGIGWSTDFEIGNPVYVRYFGRDMVVYRGESGNLIATQAYCPHMGARMDVGGKIDGDCIICPFHAWKWDAQGNNVDIPYADKTMKAKLRMYHVIEVGRMVWMWNSWKSDEPTWDPPEVGFLEGEPYFWDDDASRYKWGNIRLTPQMVAENIVDGPHIQFVRIAEEGGHISSIDIDGPVFNVVVDQTFRTGKGPVLGRTHSQSLGVGTQISTMQFGDYKVVNVLATTPIEEDRCDMRASIFITLPEGMEAPRSAKDLPPKLQKLIRSHIESQEQDIPLWETMIYEAHPMYVSEEIQGHVKLRNWAKQFYQPAA